MKSNGKKRLIDLFALMSGLQLRLRTRRRGEQLLNHVKLFSRY